MNEKIKQALENFKCIKEDLDYFQPKDLVCTNREEQYKSVENALADFDRYHESQQDLIKGKDEYIAKLCCDRAELKEHEKELIAEQHRLFDLAKEQENELKDLREFSKIVVKKRVDVYSILMTVSCIEYNERISYYYPSLADKKYLKKLLLTEEEWQFLKKLMRKEEYGKKED